MGEYYTKSSGLALASASDAIKDGQLRVSEASTAAEDPNEGGVVMIDNPMHAELEKSNQEERAHLLASDVREIVQIEIEKFMEKNKVEPFETDCVTPRNI